MTRWSHREAESRKPASQPFRDEALTSRQQFFPAATEGGAAPLTRPRIIQDRDMGAGLPGARGAAMECGVLPSRRGSMRTITAGPRAVPHKEHDSRGIASSSDAADA